MLDNDAFRNLVNRHQRRRVVPTRRRATRLYNTPERANLATKGAWFAAELAGRLAALGGSMERGRRSAPPRSVSEAVERIKLD